MSLFTRTTDPEAEHEGFVQNLLDDFANAETMLRRARRAAMDRAHALEEEVATKLHRANDLRDVANRGGRDIG